MFPAFLHGLSVPTDEYWRVTFFGRTVVLPLPLPISSFFFYLFRVLDITSVGAQVLVFLTRRTFTDDHFFFLVSTVILSIIEALFIPVAHAISLAVFGRLSGSALPRLVKLMASLSKKAPAAIDA